ncbi:hypothetical protein GWC95_18440 [Sediminibacterium roseum]|uniref:Uncharacterized protein n=1 Tax=Sediminibacterium roseum TaxID=1978412 RepID=A0ABW9ZXY7_9BACT|nr:hypothetical protein [Sediminibacterium roseum]NCI51909.1 hypothetical protein [Sediminibacterium roseum]
MLAYADCSVIAIANGDPLLCDCNKIVETAAIPDFPAQQDKQKDISLKTDWKYFGETAYHFYSPVQAEKDKKLPSSTDLVQDQFPRSVFHPPQV